MRQVPSSEVACRRRIGITLPTAAVDQTWHSWTRWSTRARRLDDTLASPPRFRSRVFMNRLHTWPKQPDKGFEPLPTVSIEMRAVSNVSPDHPTQSELDRLVEPPPPHLAPIPVVSGRPADLLPGHRLVTIAGGDSWMEAEAFVYEMYVKIGYTDPSPRHQVEELARWSDRSRFHAVVDADGRIIGTIRTIFGCFEDLPVSHFERTDHADIDPVCEFSSLVVDPRQRSTGVIEHLYRAAWLDAWRSGSNAVVALIDDWLFDAFCQTYRLPFRQIGLSRAYMGAEPLPVSMPLRGPDYLDLARSNPHFWAWTLEAVEPTEVRDWQLPIVLVDAVPEPTPDGEPLQTIHRVTPDLTGP